MNTPCKYIPKLLDYKMLYANLHFLVRLYGQWPERPRLSRLGGRALGLSKLRGPSAVTKVNNLYTGKGGYYKNLQIWRKKSKEDYTFILRHDYRDASHNLPRNHY